MGDNKPESRWHKMNSVKLPPRYVLVKFLQLCIAGAVIVLVVAGLWGHKIWKNINDFGLIDAQMAYQKSIRDGENTGQGKASNEIDISEAVFNYFWNAPDFRSFALPDKYCSVYIIVIPCLKGEAGEGAHIEIRGEFPYARYMCWTNYLYGGGGLIDFIPDNLIQPDQGLNPLQKESGGFAAAMKYPKNSYVLSIKDLPPEERPSKRPQNVIWGGYSPKGEPVEANLFAQRIYAKLPLLPDRSGYPDARQWLAQGQVPMPRCYYVIDDPDKAPYKTFDEIKAALDKHNQRAKIFVNAFVQLNEYHNERSEDLRVHCKDVFPDRQVSAPDWVIGGSPNVLKAFMWAYMDNPILSRIARRMPMFTPKISDTFNFEALYFPNWQTGYLAAHLNPEANDCYVFRFKARTFSRMDQGEPVNYGSWNPVNHDYGPEPETFLDDTFDQVRYFSVSIYKTYLFALSDTLKDAELKVDPDGYITVVVSSRDKKPAGDPVLGESFNWLEWGSPYPAVVIREMYAHPGYREACYWRKQEIEQDRSPENKNSHFDVKALKDHMGDYYPYGGYCTKEEFEINRGGLMPKS